MKYNPALDGLRAVAVVAVMLFHVTDYSVFPGGWIGVDVFFVLSGYLITSLLIAEHERSRRIHLMNFYARRALRLMPALGLVIIAALAVGLFQHKLAEMAESAAYAATYTMNWNRAFGWGPQTGLGHTWSLAMEEQFYLLWPLVFICFRHALVPFVIAAIGAVTAWRCFLVLQGANAERTYNGFDTHSDGLFIGCLLALAPNLFRSGPLVAGGAALGLLAITFSPQDNVHAQTWVMTAVAVFTALIIKNASAKTWLNNALSQKYMVFTGRISYGLYLWHWLIYSTVDAHLPSQLWGLIVIPVSYGVAILSYTFVEAPFLRWKARLHEKAFTETTAPKA